MALELVCAACHATLAARRYIEAYRQEEAFTVPYGQGRVCQPFRLTKNPVHDSNHKTIDWS